MSPHIPEELSPRIDWGTLVIAGNYAAPEILTTRTEERTAPTNRSCASRTKSKQHAFRKHLDGPAQSAIRR
jgi:hypothetical protein